MTAATGPRSWRTPRLPELVGNKQACEILGVSKVTVGRWLEPGSGEGHGFAPDDTYLIPPQLTSAGRVWAADDLRRFKASRGNRRGGRAAATEPR